MHFLPLLIKSYLLCTVLIREFYEQFGNLPFLEDEHLDDGPIFAEFLVDELVGDFESDGIVDANEEHSGWLLLFSWSS